MHEVHAGLGDRSVRAQYAAEYETIFNQPSGNTIYQASTQPAEAFFSLVGLDGIISLAQHRGPPLRHLALGINMWLSSFPRSAEFLVQQ